MSIRWTLRLIPLTVLLTSASMASAGEWISLFDGMTLQGWEQKNGTATYEVVDGTIRGTTSEGSPNSFLCSQKEYGNFELEFDVLVDDGLNSGVQIRSQTKPGDASEGTGKKKANDGPGRVYGPQVEIESSGEQGAEAGYIYGEATGLGWLVTPENLKPTKKMKDGEWNHFRVIADGPRFQTFINGELVCDLTHEEIYGTHPRGFLGLQVHGIPKGKGPYQVAWKNIRIRELN